MSMRKPLVFIAILILIVATCLATIFGMSYLGVLKTDTIELNITVSGGEYTYDGLEHTASGISYDTKKLQSGDTLTVNSYTKSITNVGEVVVEAVISIKDKNGADASSNYKITQTPGVVKVNKRNLKVYAKDVKAVYTASVIKATDFIVDSNTPLAVGDSISPTFLTEVEDVTASAVPSYLSVNVYNSAGSNVTDNYNVDTSTIVGSIEVDKCYIEITGSGTKTFDNKPVTESDMTYSFKSNLDNITISNLKFSSDLSSYKYVSDSGNITTTDSSLTLDIYKNGVLVDPSNYTILLSNFNLKILPYDVSVVTSTNKLEYTGGAIYDMTLDETSSFSTFIKESNLNVVVPETPILANDSDFIDVGSYENKFEISIYDGETDISKNFNFKYVYGTTTITKRVIEIQSNDIYKEYDGKALEITENDYKFTDSDDLEFLNSCDITVSTIYSNLVNATIDSYYDNKFNISIYKDGKNISNNFEYSYTRGELVDKVYTPSSTEMYGHIVINKLTLTYKIDDLEKTYDKLPISNIEIPFVSSNLEGLASGDILSDINFKYNLSAKSTFDAGTYPISDYIYIDSFSVINSKSSNVTQNYDLVFDTTDKSIIVNKATITSSDLTYEDTLEYSGEAQEPSVTFDGSKVLVNATSNINVGTYEVAVRLDNNKNYILESGSKITYSIVARSVDFTWTKKDYTYTGSSQEVTLEPKDYNVVGSDYSIKYYKVVNNVEIESEFIDAGDYVVRVYMSNENYTPSSQTSFYKYSINKLEVDLNYETMNQYFSGVAITYDILDNVTIKNETGNSFLSSINIGVDLSKYESVKNLLKFKVSEMVNNLTKSVTASDINNINKCLTFSYNGNDITSNISIKDIDKEVSLINVSINDENEIKFKASTSITYGDTLVISSNTIDVSIISGGLPLNSYYNVNISEEEDYYYNYIDEDYTIFYTISIFTYEDGNIIEITDLISDTIFKTTKINILKRSITIMTMSETISVGGSFTDAFRYIVSDSELAEDIADFDPTFDNEALDTNTAGSYVNSITFNDTNIYKYYNITVSYGTLTIK